MRALPVLACIALALSGCGGRPGTAERSGARLSVVAAENFWGDIAAQLGGSRVSVQSIVTNPDADPHAFEPTASDAIRLAESQLAIINGIGYDPWARQLIDANPSSSRVVLDVGATLGLRQGDNPHVWYSPTAVMSVIRQLTRDLSRLDPRHSSYFEARRRELEQRGLARYDELVHAIRSRYAGVPVGYSESVFTPLGQALRLRLLTPYAFAKAIAEGTDVSAADKLTVDSQAQSHRIRVWVYNSQNLTPDVQRVTALARAAGIPVVAITETLSPAGQSFEQWQVAQLARLRWALRRATGR